MTIFKLPDLGEGLPDAEVREWYVKEGDEVKLDQPMVSMETAKAVVDVPSPQAGRIVKLHGKPGDVIKTGDPLVTYASAEGAVEKVEVREDSGTVVGVIETSDVVLKESATGVEVKSFARSTVKAIPAVRALAAKLKVDLTTLTGTGPGNTITADDVNAAASAGAAPIGEPLQGARRIMATQMAKSHAEIVPVTLIEDADLHQWPQKVDITLRVIAAITAACKAEPVFNAHFYGQTASRKLISEINLGIAVDTPAGLYVPVIKDVANQTPESLRATLNEFKVKAANKSFSPEDLQNATITLSNFGTIAGRYANPIVVPPMVAIVGIGKTRPTPVAVDNQVAIHPVMPVCVTFDHRAITGGEAARFLDALLKDLQKA